MIYNILISFILIGNIAESRSELTTTEIPITNGICDLVKCRNGIKKDYVILFDNNIIRIISID